MNNQKEIKGAFNDKGEFEIYFEKLTRKYRRLQKSAQNLNKKALENIGYIGYQYMRALEVKTEKGW